MIFTIFKLGLHKRVLILTLKNEIPKIPLNRTVGSVAPHTHQLIIRRITKEVQAWMTNALATLSFHSASLQHFAHFPPYVFSLKYEPHTTTIINTKNNNIRRGIEIMINLKGRFDFSLEFQIFLSNSRIFLFSLQPNTVTKRIFFLNNFFYH